MLPASLKMNQHSANKKAQKIRNEGGKARVIKGSHNGNPSFRVYFRYEPKDLMKKKRR